MTGPLDEKEIIIYKPYSPLYLPKDVFLRKESK